MRRRDAVGARVEWAADHHWIDAAVVPAGTAPPADDPALPHCLWIESGRRAAGRSVLKGIEMPVMTLDLARLPEPDAAAERVAIGEIGAVNDVGADASVQWVATDPAHRRQGLGTRVMRALLADARRRGARTASLQASPDGFPLYERLGFTTVGRLHAHVR